MGIQPVPTYTPKGISLYVPNCQYAVDADVGNVFHTAEWLNPLALDADGLLDGVQMVNGSAVTVTALAAAASATEIGNYGLVPCSSLTVPDGWGRCVSAVASSTNTRVMTVTGYDYLGQLMIEAITLTSGTPVLGKKAFRWVTSISFASASDTTTVDVGWCDKFGLPYAGETMISEMKDGAVAANAGTFVGALVDATTPTATNADTRGTYLPVTVIPDGAHDFRIIYVKRRDNLHGNAQYSG